MLSARVQENHQAGMDAETACRQAETYLQASVHSHNKDGIQKAISIYQGLILSDPQLADPYLGIAFLVFSGGRYEEALAILDLPQSHGVNDMRLEKMKLRMTRVQKKKQASSAPLPIQKLEVRLRDHMLGIPDTERDEEFTIINF